MGNSRVKVNKPPTDHEEMEKVQDPTTGKWSWQRRKPTYWTYDDEPVVRFRDYLFVAAHLFGRLCSLVITIFIIITAYKLVVMAWN